MDRGAWRATVHRVTQNWTWLRGCSTHFCSANLSYNPVLYIPNAYSVLPLECLIDISNNEIQNWTFVSLATSALPTGFHHTMAVPFFQLLRPKTLVGSRTPLSFSHHTWFISKSCWGYFQYISQMWPFLITYSARGLAEPQSSLAQITAVALTDHLFFYPCLCRNPPVPQPPSPVYCHHSCWCTFKSTFKSVRAYKTLFKTFISHCVMSPCHSTPAVLVFLLFLEHFRYIPAIGPLYWVFLCLKHFFLHIELAKNILWKQWSNLFC